MEIGEVVATNNKNKLMLGVCLMQMLQGVPGVGRTGQVKLEIGGTEVGIVFESQSDEMQSDVLVEQVGVMALEWILR
jgi:hypothetical protein